jgi:mannose-6-phosphate isomerase-like protein (cupin superfamily)
VKLNLIHQDNRGRILSLISDNFFYPEVTIFETNAGFARGGCVHNINDEYCTVISGQVEYVIGDELHILSDGMSIKIPKGTPHYFISWGYSVVLEWGATVEEKGEKHKEFRQIVDRINDSQLL